MVAIKGYPFDTGFSSLSYEDDFTEYFQHAWPTGVLPNASSNVLGSYAAEFLVAGDNTGMRVRVNQGRAILLGHFAKIADADAPSGYINLPLTAAHATLPRIDRVVIKLDKSVNVVSVEAKAGTAATAPVPPALVQGATVWELPLALVYVAAAVGTIGPADVLDERVFSLTHAEVARAVPMDDPILNGGFTVWQTGTNFPNIAPNAHAAEGWMLQYNTSSLHQVQISTDVPAVAEADAPFQSFSMLCTTTTPDTSVTPADAAYIEHRVEGWRIMPLLRRGFTLPFWCKSSRVGPHCVTLLNAGPDRHFVGEYVIRQASTWERHWIHVPPSPSAGTWDAGQGLGLRVIFPLGCGTNSYTPTPGVWANGPLLCTSRTANLLANAGDFFQLGMVGPAKPGHYIYPFVGRPHGVEKVLAERYYEQSYDNGVPPGTNMSVNLVQVTTDGPSLNQIPGPRFRAPKRTTPTVVIYSKAGTPATVSNVGMADAIGGCSASDVGTNGARIVLLGSSGTAYTAYNYHYTASARL